MKIIKGLIVSFFLAVSSTSHANEISAYFIGNSLSWDAINGGAMVDLFANGGVALSADYHIRCSSSLANTYANPGDPCVTPPGNTWDQALPSGNFDLLIVQPHESGTTADEIATIQTFSAMNPAQLVIYEAYPNIGGAADLNAFYNQADQENFAQTRAEFSEIREAFPNAVFIPAMDVLLAFDEAARRGELIGISSVQDIYRDGRHLNNMGKYILGLTFYASLTGLDPRLTGIELHERYAGVSAQEAFKIQEIVAGVTYVPLPGAAWLFISALLPTVLVRFRSAKLQSLKFTELTWFIRRWSA